MPSDLIAQHQQRFDREFPHGAIVSWDRPGSATYLIPRILVTGQRGLDPEIWLPVFAGSDKTLGPFAVLSMARSQGRPYALRVMLDDGDALLLNAGVSEQAAQAMAADRRRFIELAPRGGARVFDGDVPE